MEQYLEMMNDVFEAYQGRKFSKDEVARLEMLAGMSFKD